MSIFDYIMLSIPLLSYAGLVIATKLGKLATFYLFAAVTLATLIVGIVSISVIKPIDAAASDMRGFVSNALTSTYIAAMLYGSFFGIKKDNYERVFIAGLLILIVSLASAVI